MGETTKCEHGNAEGCGQCRIAALDDDDLLAEVNAYRGSLRGNGLGDGRGWWPVLADRLTATLARLSAAERERDEAVAEKDVYYRDLIAAGELRVSEQEAAFARGVEAAAQFVGDAILPGQSSHLATQIRALAPATDAGKETT